jgi:hypothetical protein
MNTLQQVADMAEKIKTIEQKFIIFQTLAVGMPKLVQEVTTTRGDIATLTKAIQNVHDAVKKRTGDLSQMDNMIVTRLMGLEQSYASLSKMFSAVVSELSDNERLDQKSVLERCRKGDEALEKQRVEEMLKLKVIEPTDKVEVGPKGSLIVLSQKFTNTNGIVDIVAEYRALEMANPQIDEKTKADYNGKVSGETVELNLPDGVLRTTIQQIYKYVEVYSKGEDATPAEQAAEQPSAQPDPQS